MRNRYPEFSLRFKFLSLRRYRDNRLQLVSNRVLMNRASAILLLYSLKSTPKIAVVWKGKDGGAMQKYNPKSNLIEIFGWPAL